MDLHVFSVVGGGGGGGGLLLGGFLHFKNKMVWLIFGMLFVPKNVKGIMYSATK